MELPLACPLPLSQFLEPRQVSPCVFDTARNSISDELENKLDAFQRWIEAHQEERIELRLEGVRVDDLVVALSIVDLTLRERMQHHQVECPLVDGYSSVISRMFDRKEVFIERDIEFRGKNCLRVKRVVAPEPLQNFPCLSASARH
jgi:hypothetical protein